LVITYDKLRVKYENLRKRSEEDKIIFAFISDYFYRYYFRFFDYCYRFRLGLKIRKKKLENDLRKSEIIIFLFIPTDQNLSRFDRTLITCLVAQYFFRPVLPLRRTPVYYKRRRETPRAPLLPGARCQMEESVADSPSRASVHKCGWLILARTSNIPSRLQYSSARPAICTAASSVSHAHRYGADRGTPCMQTKLNWPESYVHYTAPRARCMPAALLSKYREQTGGG
jgi:hypothetical protein